MGDNQYPPHPSPIREGRNAASPFTLHFSLKQRAAFTLAEVLITLGVIGVVAALTMPSLIANYQKKVWVNQLKKTYATLNEGFRQIMVNEGCTDLICAGLMDSNYNFVNNESNINKIVTTLKLSNVETSTSSNSIYDYEIRLFSKTYPSSSFITLTENSILSGTSPDGYIVAMIVPPNDFFSLLLTVDVNGQRKPNILGRDIFMLSLIDYGQVVSITSPAQLAFTYSRKKNGTAPDNTRYQELFENTVKPNCYGQTATGEYCSDVIIHDGWQMNY